MQQEIITAIDFGSKKLSASVAIRGEEEIQILNTKSCKSAGIEKGMLEDTVKCREVVKNLLEELEEKLEKEIVDVSIGISSRKMRITEKTIKVDLKENKVTCGDIKCALEKCKKSTQLGREESIIDELINFYVVDDKIVNKSILNWKCSKVELNLTLVIVDTKEIQKYYEIFEGTKYKIKYVKSNILSGNQIFLNEKESVGDCILADIGAGEIDIALFDKNCIPKYITSIPVGGNNISNDLAIAGNLSLLEANNIKKIYSSNYKALYMDDSIPDEIEVGTTKISKKLFYEVINLRIEEILNLINIELKKTGHYDRICSIILYGDGVSYFEDINEIVEKIFKIKTKVVTGIDLGIKNSENITSLAIVKEVYDRLNLIEDNSKISVNKNIKQVEVNKTEKLHYNEDENHILKKLKSFFDKIF